MAERIDPAAVRAGLAEPRTVARALGLEDGARREGAGGLVVRCPVHGDHSPSLSLQVRGGTLSARCWACGWGGDLLALVAVVERLDVRRDFVEVLRRAAELAGGAVATCKPSLQVREEAPRLPEDVATELFGRICEEGRLGARGVVERYLEGRGLLEAAREDGWASLPSLNRILDIASEVWQERCARRIEVRAIGNSCGAAEPSGQVSGGFAFSSPEDLLVAARLAFWGRGGELVMLWGRHRLVIPWRGPDGRIQTLQRRLVDASRKMRDGREEPRYVLTWAPRWPYGVERLDGGAGVWQAMGDASAGVQAVRPTPGDPGAEASADAERNPVPRDRGRASGKPGAFAFAPVVFVEGAIDALALRCLRPGRCVPLGLPGTGGWVTAWAGLVGERKVFWGLDVDRAGDERAAKGAIDVAEAQGRLTADGARGTRRTLADRLGTPGEAARCVLCRVDGAHLCAACGRAKPRHKDWADAWQARRTALR